MTSSIRPRCVPSQAQFLAASPTAAADGMTALTTAGNPGEKEVNRTAARLAIAPFGSTRARLTTFLSRNRSEAASVVFCDAGLALSCLRACGPHSAALLRLATRFALLPLQIERIEEVLPALFAPRPHVTSSLPLVSSFCSSPSHLRPSSRIRPLPDSRIPTERSVASSS